MTLSKAFWPSAAELVGNSLWLGFRSLGNSLSHSELSFSMAER